MSQHFSLSQVYGRHAWVFETLDYFLGFRLNGHLLDQDIQTPAQQSNAQSSLDLVSSDFPRVIVATACQSPPSKHSKISYLFIYFLVLIPWPAESCTAFLVPVAAQACNKLSSNELEPPVLGDVSASCFSAGAGSGIFFFLKP